MTKVFEDDLVLEENKTFEESIQVHGNIYCKDGGKFNIVVKGSIDARDIDAESIDAGRIDASDISFYSYCISRQTLKCFSIEGRRDNSLYKCLDSEIEFKEEPETCECCGQKIKEEEAEEQ